ncbi:hypothetical protein ACCS64_38850, partial [Rhizobium ruizarguesonis]
DIRLDDRKRITADLAACCKQFERDPAAVAADAERTLEISFVLLSADIGGNRLTGNVEFSPSLETTGALTFDFHNVGLLAALGGQ